MSSYNHSFFLVASMMPCSEQKFSKLQHWLVDHISVVIQLKVDEAAAEIAPAI